MATTAKSIPRTIPELNKALKTVEAQLEEFRNVTSRQLWREAFQKDQEAAAKRGEVFHVGKTGPALEAFNRYEEITENMLLARKHMLRWALGLQEEW